MTPWNILELGFPPLDNKIIIPFVGRYVYDIFISPFFRDMFWIYV